LIDILPAFWWLKANETAPGGETSLILRHFVPAAVKCLAEIDFECE
jgi:hypothetical protein